MSNIKNDLALFNELVEVLISEEAVLYSKYGGTS
jgi:hypothetical protein